MAQLGQRDLEDLVQGAALLGSGGGGSIAAGQAFTTVILQRGGVTLLAGDPPGGTGCVVADIGANAAFESDQVQALDNCIQLMRAQLGKGSPADLTCLFAVETGPENSLAPMVCAAGLGVPVFDGDGAGRAVPELPLCTYAAAGLSVQPLTVTNGGKDAVVAFANGPQDMDDMLRPITAAKQFGSSASMALWAAPVADLARNTVPGSISYAIALGAFLRAMREGDQAAAQKLVPMVDKRSACVLASGAVSGIDNTEAGAFDTGTVTITPDDGSGTVTIITQNENLIAFAADRPEPLAVAPHTIGYLRSGWEAITNAEIKVGDHVRLIAVHAVDALLTPPMRTAFAGTLRGLGYGGAPATIAQGMAFSPMGGLLLGLGGAKG